MINCYHKCKNLKKSRNSAYQRQYSHLTVYLTSLKIKETKTNWRRAASPLWVVSCVSFTVLARFTFLCSFKDLYEIELSNKNSDNETFH